MLPWQSSLVSKTSVLEEFCRYGRASRTTAVLVGDNVPLLALQYLQYHIMIHCLCIQQLNLVRRLVREFTISKFSYRHGSHSEASMVIVKSPFAHVIVLDASARAHVITRSWMSSSSLRSG